MKDKYADLERDFQKTASELADITGWTCQQSEKVLTLLTGITRRQAKVTVRQQRAAQRNAKTSTARKLLENYRALKVSVACGTEHTLRILEDAEYLRLMQVEESLQNQSLRSLAELTAGNRVLWTQLNTALDCYKKMCEHDTKPQIRRGYPLIYARYLAEDKMSMEDILDKFAIEKSQYYLCLNEAYATLGVILFGSGCAEDFCMGKEG